MSKSLKYAIIWFLLVLTLGGVITYGLSLVLRVQGILGVIGVTVMSCSGVALFLVPLAIELDRKASATRGLRDDNLFPPKSRMARRSSR